MAAWLCARLTSYSIQKMRPVYHVNKVALLTSSVPLVLDNRIFIESLVREVYLSKEAGDPVVRSQRYK